MAIMGFVNLAVVQVSCIFSYAMVARRFHDFGRSEWAVLLFVIPIVNMIIMIVVGIIPGNKHANKYGEKAWQPDQPYSPPQYPAQ
ncbi:MAG: DUF805 domain-containing protein [Deltaproteobacteria bacterium]|jgi:uncharacterized membrane protein YhaH (DUF805 family)|nr:DUF805 domain-containing protein [Deltaproteobacteria bacterium]